MLYLYDKLIIDTRIKTLFDRLVFRPQKTHQRRSNKKVKRPNKPEVPRKYLFYSINSNLFKQLLVIYNYDQINNKM